MEKYIDYTGKRYGKLLVIGRAKVEKQGTYWLCQCDCGNTRIVNTYSFKAGNPTSCGCEKRVAHNFIDLTGQRFGRWTVVSRAEKRPSSKQAMWTCKCDCGNMGYVSSQDLRTGISKSCGCYNIEVIKKRDTKHGCSGTRLYNIWLGIRDRTKREANQNYYRYGGRGIDIYPPWRDNFLEFKSWSDENGYDDTLTIDRIDNDRGYYPDNCRWTDYLTQANNTSKNLYIILDGEKHTLSEWCRIKNVDYSMVRGRIKRGWEKDMWFIPPVRKKKVKEE